MLRLCDWWVSLPRVDILEQAGVPRSTLQWANVLLNRLLGCAHAGHFQKNEKIARESPAAEM
jgi:hypothetical protein